MIVRNNPKLWNLFFILRGSILPRITPLAAAIAGLSLIVVILQRIGTTHITPIAPLSLSIIGAALAIFSSLTGSGSR